MKSNLVIAWSIALGLTGWLLYLLAPILTPFVASALLAYIGDPLCDRLERYKLPRTLAVVVVFLLTFATLGLLVLLVGPLIKNQVTAFLTALPAIVANVEQVWLPTLAEMLDIELGEDMGLSAFLARYSDMAGEWGQRVLVSAASAGGMLATAVMSLFLVPILTFYLLRDWDHIVGHISALLPDGMRAPITEIASETDDVLGAFLRGQLSVMFALAVIYSTGLSLVGVDFAIAIGVVSGLVSFVPYLGLIFGILLASLTVALQPDPLWPLAGVIATFVIAQLLEGTVLTPKLVGDQIGLHPVLVIFAIAGGGQLFGFFGILLALPAAAVLSVLVRFAYNNYLKEHPEIAIELGESSRDERE